MKRTITITFALGAIGALALGAAALATPSSAHAQTPGAEATSASGAGPATGPLERLRARAKAAEVAVAFGLLSGDEDAVIDFRAAKGPLRSGGRLRFWSEDDGFYNGAVRTLVITGKNVHAEGAGPLTRPDGTRVRVKFALDLNGETGQLTVKATGEGVDYTLSGTVQGRVFVGKPGQP